MVGIYAIRNKITDRAYVGSSKDIKHRWLQHRTSLRKGEHHCLYLQRAWDKYGEDNFDFEVLEECEESLLLVHEQMYLDTYEDLYNLSKIAGKPKNPKEDISQLRKLKLRSYLRWLKSTKFQDSFERCDQHDEGSELYRSAVARFDEFYDFVEDVTVDAFSNSPIIIEDQSIEDDPIDPDELDYFLIQRPK